MKSGTSNFATRMKPYFFDLLKRNKKFDHVKKGLATLSCDDNINNTKILSQIFMEILNIINEKELICCFIESVSNDSLP